MAQLIQRRHLAYLKKTKLDNLLLFHLSTSKNITSPLYNIVLSLIFFRLKVPGFLHVLYNLVVKHSPVFFG